jgi:hypothetical protein
MTSTREQHAAKMRERNAQKPEPIEDFSDITRPADEWLWIPYALFHSRLRSRQNRTRDVQAYRDNSRIATQQWRARLKREKLSREIAAVYWSEVERPIRPARHLSGGIIR